MGARARWRWLASPTAVATVVAVVLTGLVLVRFARPGLVLYRDLVFVPRPAFRPELIGLSSGPPRGVPSELWQTVLSGVFGAGIAERLTLAAVLVGAGVGTGRVAATLAGWCREPANSESVRSREAVRSGEPGGSRGQDGCGCRGGNPAAVTAAAFGAAAGILNVYVAERLLIGQWVVLVGYAALGWVFLAGLRLGLPRPRGGHGFAPAMGAMLGGSVGGPQAWVLVTPVFLIAVAAGVRSDRNREATAGAAAWSALRRAAAGGAIVLASASVWLAPALARPGALADSAVNADVFRPRADLGLGLVTSLLTGGGIWNAEAVPPARSAPVVVIAGVVVLLLAGWGAARSWRGRTRGLTALAVVGALGLGLALLGALRGGDIVLAAVPGGGLARDAQRFVGLWVFAIGASVGLAAALLWELRHLLGRVALGVAAAALVLGSPALLAGQSIASAPVRFPADYAAVRGVLDRAGDRTAVLVLPWGGYRTFGWNGGVPVTEPLPGMLDRPVVTSSALTVLVHGTPVTVPEDDTLARAAGEVLASPRTPRQRADALAELGIGWIVVDAGSPVAAPTTVSSTPVFQGRWLVLARVDSRLPVAGSVSGRPPVSAGWVGLAVWLSAGAAAIGVPLRRRARARSRRSSASR